MIVYLIRNTTNGKCYVGQTTQTLERRWGCHRSTARTGKGDTLISKALRKYGEDKFTIEPLEEAEDRHDLDMAERAWVAIYDCMAPRGYNLESGGNRYKTQSAETIEKKRKASTGRVMSPETRKRMSDAALALPAEFKTRRGKAKLGYKQTPEARLNMSLARRGEKNRPLKLSWDKVREIRSLYATGAYTQSGLAVQFGCGPTIIWGIVNNKKWIEA